MVVDIETKDSLKRRAVMVIAKKLGLACADLLYYSTNNIHFLLHTSMVLIYNSELGIIISSRIFSTQRNSGRSVIYSLVFYLFFYLSNLSFI